MPVKIDWRKFAPISLPQEKMKLALFFALNNEKKITTDEWKISCDPTSRSGWRLKCFPHLSWVSAWTEFQKLKLAVPWRSFNPEKMPCREFEILIYKPAQLELEERSETDVWGDLGRGRLETLNSVEDWISLWCPLSDIELPEF